MGAAKGFRRKRAIFLGGHYHGCAGLAVLRMKEKIRRIIDTQFVYADIGNNVENRLYRLYKDRAREQRRIVEFARVMKFRQSQIIAKPYSNDLLLELIEERELDMIIIATFGALVQKSAIEAVNGNVFVCHPCFELRDDAKHLPEKSRGAKVMDRIVTPEASEVGLPKPVMMQIALLRANEFFDAGPIVGRTNSFPSPFFDRREMAKKNLGFRVDRAQAASAPYVGTLIRYNLLPQVANARQLHDAKFTPTQLLKMGLSKEELRKAGMKIK